MRNVKIINIKNKNEGILLKIKANMDFEKPILYINPRKNKKYALRLCPKKVRGKYLIYYVSAKDVSPLNLYYDVYFEYVDKNGQYKQQRVCNDSRSQRRLINLLNLKKQVVIQDHKKYLITEYFAVGGYLAFQIRKLDKYDHVIYRFKEALSCLLVPFVYWYYKDSKLIYEKFSNYARDNSFYYFSYIQKHNQKNKLYYVIKKDSPDINKLEHYKKRIVYFMSTKHILLILLSKYFVASESKGHAYAWRHNQSIARFCLNRKPFVFLQHGVLGLKQVDHTFFANNRLNHADLFITSSEVEKQIVLKFLGYYDKNVAVTGLARWDNPNKLQKKKKIFVMPTWRIQLDLLSDEQFLKSKFFQAYNNLLCSDKIRRILSENHYTLHFMLHPKFVRFEKYFLSDDKNIKIIRQKDVPIDMELRTSRLVVTDYSSIIWDALYYDCPTLLFQFDQEEYLQVQGSYLDFESDLKDIIIKDSQSLLDEMSTFMQKNKIINLSGLQNRYFSYQDKSNSKRINESIIKWETNYHFDPLYKRIISKLKN